MQARRSARELVLLSISQLPTSPERLETQQIHDIVTAAVRTLVSESYESLETAMAELQRGSDRLQASQFRASDLPAAQSMIQEAIELTQSAINRVGTSIELPELLQLSKQEEIHAYAVEILMAVNGNREDIDQRISQAMVDWQINRLPRLDRDILRIAVAEVFYLEIQEQVALNEAVELAKRYGDEESYRFINGVLRRVVDRRKKQALFSEEVPVQEQVQEQLQEQSSEVFPVQE
ncbi:MAG: transcription antitermination protein NusB [Oscillatoriales cyanobacterium RM2_1_1]|nr:transcription antitermination protein NusB [Oscillatoriales cyanobacterium SM2_3_0]NJO47014.1 transcription antitermination protein NusB [Oscillatoriales cyanobacterium RM2_1_1]